MPKKSLIFLKLLQLALKFVSLLLDMFNVLDVLTCMHCFTTSFLTQMNNSTLKSAAVFERDQVFFVSLLRLLQEASLSFLFKRFHDRVWVELHDHVLFACLRLPCIAEVINNAGH